MNKPSIPFVEFPKISRLSREIIITEKIDGTNAQIYIPDVPTCVCGHGGFGHVADGKPCFARPGPTEAMCDCKEFRNVIFTGSRTKWISPDDDNMGFAKWVQKNREELLRLGPGSHFGEWWGQGIQRNYGLKEKRFSLFNVSRWSDPETRPTCCDVVPVLYRGAFQMEAIDATLVHLRENGSVAAPGFMKPEGVVIYHVAGGHLYKKTLEKDAQPKSVSGA